jgi:ribosome-associated heat shock protein Hsp15
MRIGNYTRATMNARRADERQLTAAGDDAALRVDLWLWYARFFRSRSLATEAVQGGKVHVNSQRVKPAHRLKVGDRVEVGRGGVEQCVEVLCLPQRRGSALEASASYVESRESIAKREALQTQHRLAAAFAPRQAVRPNKHERRSLRRLRGRGD